MHTKEYSSEGFVRIVYIQNVTIKQKIYLHKPNKVDRREIIKVLTMANVCMTDFKVTGSRKAVNDLWNVLQKMEVNSKNVLLYQLAEQYGIDYEKNE